MTSEPLPCVDCGSALPPSWVCACCAATLWRLCCDTLSGETDMVLAPYHGGTGCSVLSSALFLFSSCSICTWTEGILRTVGVIARIRVTIRLSHNPTQNHPCCCLTSRAYCTQQPSLCAVGDLPRPLQTPHLHSTCPSARRRDGLTAPCAPCLICVQSWHLSWL